jgi:hypothetical protein
VKVKTVVGSVELGILRLVTLNITKAGFEVAEVKPLLMRTVKGLDVKMETERLVSMV